MILSGFYMSSGINSKDARVNSERMFVEGIAPMITKIFRRANFLTTDIIRTKEYDEDNGLKAYDVHFVLELPNANIKEDTRAFYDLEAIVLTGLRVVEDEELLKDAI